MHKTDSSDHLVCPCCEEPLDIKVNKDTILLRFPLYCLKCKNETVIDLIEHKIYISKNPLRNL